MTYYSLERLLARIAAGTTTAKDAEDLRRFLLVLGATAPVVWAIPA